MRNVTPELFNYFGAASTRDRSLGLPDIHMLDRPIERVQ